MLVEPIECVIVRNCLSRLPILLGCIVLFFYKVLQLGLFTMPDGGVGSWGMRSASRERLDRQYTYLMNRDSLEPTCTYIYIYIYIYPLGICYTERVLAARLDILEWKRLLAAFISIANICLNTFCSPLVHANGRSFHIVSFLVVF